MVGSAGMGTVVAGMPQEIPAGNPRVCFGKRAIIRFLDRPSSERFFSLAGQTLDDRRFRLSADSVDGLDLDLDSSRQSPTGYHGDEVCTPTGMSEWSAGF